MNKSKQYKNLESKKNIEVYESKHLPLVKEFAERIGLVETINKLVPSEMDIDPGTMLLGLILDTLSGRTPLYRLEEFFENQDTELLLGKSVSEEAFADHNVARVLDKVYEAGTMKVFSEISRNALEFFNIDSSHVSFDTTSVNVYGDYEDYSKDEEDASIKIAHGYSKDHRPDLKQFLISMLCVDRNIPIFGKTEDGNASDKNINNAVLSHISKHMREHGLEKNAFIYIADSAMVTEKNLKEIGEEIQFITRLSATYKECERVIAEAVSEKKWEEIGVLSITKATKNRPTTSYKGYEGEVELYGKKYRATVVHSSAHDKRRQKKIERELKSNLELLESEKKKTSKKEFFCEKDARAEMKEIESIDNKYYKINSSIKEVPKYKKGRPKGGVKEVKEMHYRVEVKIEEKEKAIEKMKEEAGCFVLVNNVPKEGEDGYITSEILKAYKDQHGIEQNFKFLKDPAIVNGIFLKKGERIEVLGLILLLALLIWRLIERELRIFVKETGEELPGWNKGQTNRPTSFMMLTKFSRLIVINIGGKRRLNRPLSEEQKKYLRALKIGEDIFTNPNAGGKLLL